MNNEKYLNHYVEILTGTMTDAVIRNISLQANARVTEELLDEQAKRIEELSIIEANRNSESSVKIANLEATIANLTNELNDLRSQRGEFESTKSQVKHVDTFRNELAKAQDTIRQLNEKIEYLQLTPAKRKKIDESKKPKEEVVLVTQSSEDTIKDGGSF